MRVLFFACPGFGHVIPQLPLTRAMRERGEQVAFVAAASLGPLLEAEGIALLAVGPEVPELAVELKRTTGVDILAAPPSIEIEAEIFAGARIDLGYEDCLAAAREFEPDLIVVDAMEYVGRLVASALEVPYAVIALGPAVRPESLAATEARSAASHAERGLTPHEARWYLDTCPAALQFDDFHAPATRRALRPEAYTGGGAVPAPDRSRIRPRVLVNFGTLFVIPELITPIVQALLTRDFDIRVTLGPMRTAEEFDIDSDRVEFVGFTPLARLLGDVDAVVTVGGAGTILGALAHGLPLVLTPLAADQPVHAGRAAAAGAGIAFPVGEFKPDDVAEAIVSVLETPDYKEAAQCVAAEIRAMKSATEVAAELAAAID
ncbi:glycosyltransferase family 1 protein [Actinospica sp. MGRD01-02]|uniref:Glycosyltransferase family 1 protein n=1 Tax=Actinospica acidithermotolerans TaxID=2828514 RepID=A0A941IJD5_9ACTN|nr:glycosyltransferase [Actinospica acidithermotolerans]MBR7829334.1 glycosyltransferase family 1 protein [Actinospica acidithermotolerans]